MTESIKLPVKLRPEGTSTNDLRRSGEIPGVVYGHEQAATAVVAGEKELAKVWQRAGRSHLVDLAVDGKTKKVLIRELQIHPRTAKVLHADFFAVNMSEKLTVDVPIVVIGEAPAVTDFKIGQLAQPVTVLKIECLPSDLPAQITVDVSGLTEIDQSITLGQIQLPHGVTLLHTDLDEVVVKIAPIRETTEEEVAAPAEGEVAPAEGAAAETSADGESTQPAE